MTRAAPRILFVPVSGAFGLGEYARSLAIAQGVKARWGDAQIRFIVSRQAPYAGGVPFPTTLLDSSPTFHSSAVVAVIDEWRPDVVIFDNAGRTAQLRAAARRGVRVVYISARRRQRRKAFRLRWMRIIDEHWIAYPEFIAGGLTLFERAKRRLFAGPEVRYLDVIFSRPSVIAGDSLLARIGRSVDDFVLVVPGGGTGHPGAENALAEFLGAAQILASNAIETVFVGGAAEQAPSPHLQRLGSLPQAELAVLMRNARLVIVNGGSTLLQAIASGGACVAAPIAGDQAERIGRCVDAGVALAVPLDAADMASTALRLLSDEVERSALLARVRSIALADGVEVAVAALATLMAGSNEGDAD